MSWGVALRNAVGLGLGGIPSLLNAPPFAALKFKFTETNTLDPRITFTRASTGTFFNSAGVLSTAANDAARFDYDPVTLAARGLLIEEQRTNSIRNNTMQGAVAGTPGTLPNNWSIANPAGLSSQVVGTGSDGGVTYLDLRLFGTTTGTQFALNFEPTTQVAALQNQAWSGSFFLTYVAGTITNVGTFSTTIVERDGSGSGITSGVNTNTLSNTNLAVNRLSNTYTLPTATAAFVSVRFDLTLTNSAAVDITLRIGLPQLELGAFATSVIPTTTTALTRAADAASMTGANFSSWYNQNEGTFVVKADTVKTSGTTPIVTAQIAGGADRHQVLMFTQTAATVVSGVSQALIGTNAAQIAGIAYSYKLDSFAACANGGTVSVDTSGSVPSSLTYAMLGKFDFGGGESLNGHIRSFAYYARQLSAGQLQTLTK